MPFRKRPHFANPVILCCSTAVEYITVKYSLVQCSTHDSIKPSTAGLRIEHRNRKAKHHEFKNQVFMQNCWPENKFSGEHDISAVRLEKAIGSKGKQPCKQTASETQTHSQSFQKKKVAGMN